MIYGRKSIIHGITFCFAIVLILFLTSCEKGLSIKEAVDEFSLEDAKVFHLEHAADLRLPNGGNNVKSTIDYEEILVPQWDNATYHEVQFPSKLVKTYEIPLNTGTIVGGVLLKEKGDSYERATMKSSLVIQEFSQGKKKTLRQMVVTVIGNDSNGNVNSEAFTYMGSHNTLTGFMVVSTLEGKIVNIFQYINGIRSKVYVKHSEDAADNAPLYGFSFLKAHGTKSSYSNSEPGICYMCGKEGMVYIQYGNICKSCLEGSELLDGIIVTPNQGYCEKCGRLQDECVCNPFDCNVCGQEPCICDGPGSACEYCDNLGCNGECRGDGDGGGGDEPPVAQDTTCMVDIVVNAMGMGTFSGDGSYKANSNVTVSAVPNWGYIFGGWTENNSLMSWEQMYTFTIKYDRCLTANFFDESSECAKLTTKYANNNALKSSISMLQNKKIENDSIEYGVYRIIGGSESKYYVGNNKGVTIRFIDGMYESCIHNHPNNKRMMSIGDLYGMYKLYENNNFTIGTPLMVLTDDGILSFEIENISVFNSFMEDILSGSDGESIDDKLDKFQDEFHNKIIGVPEGSSINDQIYFNKAIEFFLQKGLKIFHTFDIEGSGIWESAKITNGKLSFINCYDNY